MKKIKFLLTFALFTAIFYSCSPIMMNGITATPNLNSFCGEIVGAKVIYDSKGHVLENNLGKGNKYYYLYLKPENQPQLHIVRVDIGEWMYYAKGDTIKCVQDQMPNGSE